MNFVHVTFCLLAAACHLASSLAAHVGDEAGEEIKMIPRLPHHGNVFYERCGDGRIDAGEECDDGNNVRTDGCTNECLEATCGDGITHAGVEECDDGNHIDTDQCTNRCKTGICGHCTMRLKLFSATSKGAVPHPSVKVTVDRGYKIISGGARARPLGSNGLLLTAMYPLSATTWLAQSKDHYVPERGAVTAYAIGLFDPFDEWDVGVWSATSGLEQHPSVNVTVPDTHQLTGGGALDDYGEPGNMLTASYAPDGVTWLAAGKDHVGRAPSRVTAYAIGVRRVDTGFRPPCVVERVQRLNVTSDAVVPFRARKGQVVVGGGGRTWWSGDGTLLVDSCPNDDRGLSWEVAAKFHMNRDTVNTETSAIVCPSTVACFT